MVEEHLQDLFTRHAGLGAHGVHALDGAAGALVADLLHADAQDFVHLDGVDVVGHGHVVDHVAIGPALLRGAADLAELGGDVVERHVLGLDAQLFEDLHDPLIEVGVGLLEAHSLHEGGGDDERVGDAVARLHEHGAAAGDAPRHGDAVALHAVLLDFVLVRLEGADDDLRAVPLPQAHEGLAAPRSHVFDQGFVHGDVDHRVDDGAVDDVEVDVVPRQGGAQRAAYGDADGFGGHAHEGVALVEGPLHARGQILGARRGRGPFEGRGDPGERVVGVEEKVAGHAHAREAILLHVGVDDDELSSGDFVLSMHAHDCRRFAHAQSGRTRTPPLSADAASMP